MALAARLRDALGARGAVALVRRRDRAPLPRRRRAARARRPPRRARRSSRTSSCRRSAATALFGSRFRENAAPRAPHPAAAARAAHAALAAAAQGAEPARGGAEVRLVPDRPRDVPRVPAGRLRPPCAARRSCAASRRGSSTSSRSRRRPPRRWPPRCSSTTSPPTCTRTTRPPPSVARRRSRSTASCSASCSARRSCATCSTRARSPRSRRRCAGSRGTPTSSTTSFDASATCARASSTPGFAETLVRERRAFRALVGDGDAVIAAEDAGLYRDAFGVMPPGGFPEAFLEPSTTRSSVSSCATRARTGRSRRATSPSRYGLEPERVEADARAASRRATFSSAASSGPAASSASGATRTSCAASAAPRSPSLRRQVEPAEQAALGRFLPAWHGIDRRATLREALVPLQGLALPVSALGDGDPAAARARLPARLARPALRLRGGRLGRRRPRPRRALLPRGRSRARAAARRLSRSAGRCTTRSAPRSRRSAEFWPDLVAATGIDAAEVLPVALGARLERRGDERRLGTAAREAPLRRARRGAPPASLLALARLGRRRDRRALVARRARSFATATPCHACPATGARSRSSCSSGRGS